MNSMIVLLWIICKLIVKQSLFNLHQISINYSLGRELASPSLFANIPLSHKVTGTPEQLHESLFGSHPDAEVILASVNGVTTGFALYFFNFSVYLMKPGLYLEALYVRPDYRRQGVGNKIFNYLANLALDQSSRDS